ncbi:putative ATP-dependent helicase IRC20 [Candida tropicalis]
MSKDKQPKKNKLQVLNIVPENIILAFKDIEGLDIQASKRRKLEVAQNIPDSIPLFRRHLKFKHKLEVNIPDHPEMEVNNFKLDRDRSGNFNAKIVRRRIRVLFSFSMKHNEIPEEECKLILKRQQDGIICDRKLTMSIKDGVLRGEITYSIGYICDMNFIGKRDVTDKVLAAIDGGSLKNDTITPEFFYRSIADSTERMPPFKNQEIDIPELQTDLLKFQKKTVNWLLSKENVKYNPQTNRVDHISFMDSEEFTDDEALSLINRLWYGWKVIDWNNKTYFLNQLSCTVATVEQMRAYLLEYFHNTDKVNNPLHLNGQGLLCEEMGLGKTIEVASLILLNPRPYYEIDRPMDLVLNEFKDIKKIVMGRTTLVIAPAPILQQWRSELDTFAPSLATTIYEGVGKYPSMRNKPYLIAAYLRKFDVVLTTYNTIARELDYAKFSSSHKRTRASRNKAQSNYGPSDDVNNASSNHSKSDFNPDDQIANNYQALFQLGTLKPSKANQKSQSSQKETDYEKALQIEIELAFKHNESWCGSSTDDYECPLMLIQFWRVVLDEVQMVSSRVSRAFQSASLIPRFHSWGVSGTPIKKNMDDLLATLKFLRFFPFNGMLGEYCWEKLSHNKEEFSKLWSQLAIRHTKSMVHDDIQLPEQSRILMTMPFTAVEQDLYSRKFEQCLNEIKLDEDGNPLVNDWDIADVVEQMRYWLTQLRKLCSSPQIGRLNIEKKKFSNFYSRLRQSGTGSSSPLKTLDSLLRGMLEKCYSEIVASGKRRVDEAIRFIELLEFIYYPEKALMYLKSAIIETEWLLNRDEIMLSKKLEEGKKSGLDTEKQISARGNDKVNYSSDDDDSFLFDSDSDDEFDRFQRWYPPAKSRYAKGNPNDEFDVDEEDELLASISRIRGRIRTSLVQLHKLYFLKASCNFQLVDEGYLETMEKYKIDVTIPKFSETYLQYRDRKQAAELAAIVSGIPVEKFLFEVDEETGYETSDPKELESIYYDKAEKIRGRLLEASIKAVTKNVETRIKSRGLYFHKPITDYGDSLLPKTSKKFFNALPIMDHSDWSNYVMHPQVSVLVNKVQRFLTLLNNQGDVMNKSMQELLGSLQAPLISQDESPLGTEYEETLDDQENILRHINLLVAFIHSRWKNISGGDSNNYGPSNQVLDAVSRKISSHINSLVQEHEVSHTMQFSTFMDDINSLLIDMSASAANAIQVEELKKLRDKIGIYQENQRLALALFSKELSVNCNAIYNSRIEYYKQLQIISDTVQRPEFESLNREKLDYFSINQVFSKMNQAGFLSTDSNVGRFRYLVELMNENASNQTITKGPNKHNSDSDGAEDNVAEEDDSSSDCIICRSTITLGALTECGHKYCKTCLDQWLKSSRSCPLCKEHISHGSVYCYTRYEPVLKVKQVHDIHDTSKLHSIYKSLDNSVIEELKTITLKRSFSSKVDMIVKQVSFLKSKDPNVQIIIFSQWQDMLFIIGNALKDNRISYMGMNSSVNPDHRRKQLIEDEASYFKRHNGVTCFLLDAKAQASGLTLTNATHIFLCEPLVNISLELQAISRIHRIGQKKRTTVWMFAIENTIEESIIITSTDKRLKYLKSNKKNTDDVDDDDNDNEIPDETDLTKAESLALVSGGGQDSVVGKAGQGEMVTNNDLWSAFFSSTMGRVIPEPSEKNN